jgi:hypothetical protein
MHDRVGRHMKLSGLGIFYLSTLWAGAFLLLLLVALVAVSPRVKRSIVWINLCVSSTYHFDYGTCRGLISNRLPISDHLFGFPVVVSIREQDERSPALLCAVSYASITRIRCTCSVSFGSLTHTWDLFLTPFQSWLLYASLSRARKKSAHNMVPSLTKFTDLARPSIRHGRASCWPKQEDHEHHCKGIFRWSIRSLMSPS